MTVELTASDKKDLLGIARESITAHLEKRSPVLPPCRPSMTPKLGAFVTLHKKGALRGCIGYMEGIKSLFDTIRELAVSSAFHDPRFPPLEKKELQSIDIEISVLSPLRRAERTGEIVTGTHGIYLTKGYRSGVLLPQVAAEYGWDTQEFLERTCQKAGLERDAWKDPATVIQIFTAVIFGEKDFHSS